MSAPHTQPDLPPARPRTRAECPDPADGPCPWLGCRHHLGLDLIAGTVRLHPLVKATETAHTLDLWPLYDACGGSVCALDLAESPPPSAECDADRGFATTLEAVGVTLGVTRERTRQIQARALRKLSSAAPELVEHIGHPAPNQPPKTTPTPAPTRHRPPARVVHAQAAEPAARTPGQWFALARHARGWRLVDVAKATRARARHIAEVEARKTWKRHAVPRDVRRLAARLARLYGLPFDPRTLTVLNPESLP